ncbi:MAG: hypothetical protein V1779_09125 [bacterium]
MKDNTTINDLLEEEKVKKFIKNSKFKRFVVMFLAESFYYLLIVLAIIIYMAILNYLFPYIGTLLKNFFK